MAKITHELDHPFDLADMRGLARLISQVERQDAPAHRLMERVYEARKGGYCLGITGPPGAGKSTLVDRLIRVFRAQGKRVGVLAIDPSSPFSGGAVLGDRVRMQAHAEDAGVYIRSIGSRGAHGGLSHATRDIVRIYDAYGFDWIIVETVGVGQTELDIMAIADTTLVVLVPEAGDTIQTMKAGLLEIADIFIVNKADRDGAEQIAQALAAMVAMGEHASPLAEDHDAAHKTKASSVASRRSLVNAVTSDQGPVTSDRSWHIPILRTVATAGEGIDDLRAAIDRHRRWRARSGARDARQSRLRAAEFMTLCEAALRERLRAALAKKAGLRKIAEAVAAGTANPYRAAMEVVRRIK